jgi:spore maturation protein CgeB
MEPSNTAQPQQQLRALESEREQLTEQLSQAAAELGRVRVRIEELEDQHRFDEQRLAVVDRERAGLRAALRDAEQRIEEAKAPLLARIEALDAQRDELMAQLAQAQGHRPDQRALVRALVRTQATLDARTEQLSRILGSRWHRVARSSWQARRRRPPLTALALAGLGVAGIVVAALLATAVATVIAAVLGAAILAALAVAYAVVVPAMRDKRIPRLAGQGTFAEPLADETATVQRLLTEHAQESEPPTLEAAPAPPAPGPGAGPPQVITRLVPALPHMDGEGDRERWLAAARTLRLGQLKVAGILDEMSRACFAPECLLNCNFTMHDWRERLDADPPHLLLVESAWSGNSGGWQYGVASYQHPDYKGLPALRELISWCRRHGIPTVFWNKEDPIHFERFKEAAALFDHVFTTDANRIGAYEDLHGEHVRSVAALPFAAQPRLHNPIAITDNRSLEPVFAGTYYRSRHQDRRASLEMLLDAARPAGLIIYDRTFGTESDEYGFPERFQPHIKGRLPYEQVIDVYKRHRVFLNVNSVIDSPTMFSRRVFELLACGTAVLSTYSAGIEATFGELVPIADSTEEATAKLERLLHDDGYYADLTARARRLVLSQHTYHARLATIAAAAGFELAPSAGSEVAAIALADRDSQLRTIEDVLLAQSRAPDEIIVGLGDEGLAPAGLEQLRERFGPARVRTVAQHDDAARPQRWRELAALAAAPWVAPLQPDGVYLEDHLRDLSACTAFAAAEVIGTAGSESAVHRYVDGVDPRAALAERALVARRGWAEDAAGQRRWFEEGIRFYAGEHQPQLARTPAVAAAAGQGGAHGAPRRTRGVRRR